MIYEAEGFILAVPGGVGRDDTFEDISDILKLPSIDDETELESLMKKKAEGDIEILWFPTDALVDIGSVKDGVEDSFISSLTTWHHRGVFFFEPRDDDAYEWCVWFFDTIQGNHYRQSEAMYHTYYFETKW